MSRMRENLSLGFLTRADRNQAALLYRLARGLKCGLETRQILLSRQLKYEPCARKPVFLVFDQVTQRDTNQAVQPQKILKI